ncbi:MAG: ATP-dependent sacrificial sulfur transferase LarE [Planctomycetota bacterium]|nr:ATP-dependent sacrificial sulfur transferase LarE [Planctomycetota bacterium]
MSPPSPNQQELESFYLHSLTRLKSMFQGVSEVAVAFSAGVDSTLLLKLLLDALGSKRVRAVTANSPSLARAELISARRIASDFGVELIEIETDELSSDDYRRNDSDRCYHCKNELFTRMAEIEGPWERVVYGANLDDLGDHRPGMQAAKEQSVGSPLVDLGLNKERIRALSRFLGLETADKPAMACLASRLPYGSEVTETKLQAIEVAEAGLRKLGFRILRVRHHGPVARLEFGAEEFDKAFTAPFRDKIVQAVREAGFQFVSLDLEPFRSGRLNDLLSSESQGALLTSAV